MSRPASGVAAFKPFRHHEEIIPEERMLFRRCLKVAALAAFLFVLAPPLPAAERTVATLAHIKLSGDLEESPVVEDMLFGLGSASVQMKLDPIKKAKPASSVQGLLLELDGLSIGWGKLDELRRAIADFRAAGKKAYAYLESGETKDYLVAL